MWTNLVLEEGFLGDDSDFTLLRLLLTNDIIHKEGEVIVILINDIIPSALRDDVSGGRDC